MLKLQHYTGTESLEAFLRKFNSMKQYLQWNEDDACLLYTSDAADE